MMENMFVRKRLALPLLWTTGAMGIRFIRYSLCSSVHVFVTRIPMQYSQQCDR
jgi:hypothetical protein